MEIPLEIPPDWVATHATLVAQILAGCGIVLLSIGGYVARLVIRRFDKAFAAVGRIERVQTVQAENHLKTIQDASLVTRDEAIKTNTKLDVLITLMQEKQ